MSKERSFKEKAGRWAAATLFLTTFVGPMTLVTARADEGDGTGRRDTAQTNNDSDVEQEDSAEVIQESVILSIPGGYYPRSAEGSHDRDRTFSAGNIEVHSFIKVEDGQYPNLIEGLWLFTNDEDGELVMFYISNDVVSVNGVTGEDLEETDLISLGLDQAIYDEETGRFITSYSPEASPTEAPDTEDQVPEVQAAPEAEEANASETEVPPTQSAPETYSFPELPDTIDVSFPNPTYPTDGQTFNETLNINHDLLLPIPLGMVEEGYSQVTDSISNWEREGDNFQRIPISGLIVDITIDPSTDARFLTLLTETPNGLPVTMIIQIASFIKLIPVNDNLIELIPVEDNDSIYDTSARVQEEFIITLSNERLEIGTHIIIDIENIPDDVSNTTHEGVIWGINSRVNAIPSGTPTAIFEAVDNGEVNNNEVLFYLSGGRAIIYNENN